MLPLFETAPLYPLPFFIVFLGEEYQILGRYYRGSVRQRYHFTLHHVFYVSCQFDNKFFSLAARFDLCIARGIL